MTSNCRVEVESFHQFMWVPTLLVRILICGKIDSMFSINHAFTFYGY